MISGMSGWGLSLAIVTMTGLAMAGGAAFAEAPAGSPAPAAMAAPKPSFVAADFSVPTLVEGPGFKLVPLAPTLAKVDFDAYMSSIEHLQQTFSRSDRWPRQGITDADALKDMENEQARFMGRKSFAYAVLTPDGKRERGCVYVYPSPVKGHDAMVRMWVTKAEYDAGFDAELYQWVTGWMRRDWPFKAVVYPGRSIAWAAWDPMVAASKPGAATAQ